MVLVVSRTLLRASAPRRSWRRNPGRGTIRSSTTCTPSSRRRAGPWLTFRPARRGRRIEGWSRARGDEVEVVRLLGTGHDATLASGEISPLSTEILV